MSVMLLIEYQLELLSSKGGCTGVSGSTFVKIPHCWKSHYTVHAVVPHDCHSIARIGCGLKFNCSASRDETTLVTSRQTAHATFIATLIVNDISTLDLTLIVN